MSDYILRYRTSDDSLSHHGTKGQKKGVITSFVGKYYVPKGRKKAMDDAKERIKIKRLKERSAEIKKNSGGKSYSKDSYEGAILGQLRAMEADVKSRKEKEPLDSSVFGRTAMRGKKLSPDSTIQSKYKKTPQPEPEPKKDKKKKNKEAEKQAKKEQEEAAQEARDDRRAKWRDAVKNAAGKTKDKVKDSLTDSESEKLKKKKVGDLTDDELEYLRKRTNSEKNLKNNLKELNKSEKPEKSSEDLVKAATDMRRAFKDISQDVQKNPPMTNPKRLKLSKYSDAELKSMISDAKKRTERMQLEDEYNSLVNSPRVNTGAVKAASALATVGTLAVVGTQVANFVITAKKMAD